jgi:hypothetical protein
MANTRKGLDRVPEEMLGWKPHKKSMTMGRPAVHLATLPDWATHTIKKDLLDLALPGPRPTGILTRNRGVRSSSCLTKTSSQGGRPSPKRVTETC